jgi:hypothetical protein
MYAIQDATPPPEQSPTEDWGTNDWTHDDHWWEEGWYTDQQSSYQQDQPSSTRWTFYVGTVYASSCKQETTYLTKTKPNEPATWDIVSLADNPTSVILDLGCTRAMGSRQAIEKFMKAAAKHHLQCEILPSQVTFSFANSETTQVKEKCRVWFPTTPPCSTDFDIIEQGKIPMLMSLSQMRNLRFELALTPEQALMTCPAFGYKAFPLKISISRHLILDLADMANSAILQGKSRLVSSRDAPLNFPSFTVDAPAARQESEDMAAPAARCAPEATQATKDEQESAFPVVSCPACAGQHRAHTCGKGKAEKNNDVPDTTEHEADVEPEEVKQEEQQEEDSDDDKPLVPAKPVPAPPEPQAGQQ